MALTKAEQAELAQLEALEAQQPQQAQPVSDQGLLGGMSEAFGQAASLGFGDEASSAIMAPFLAEPGESYGDTYERLQAQNQARIEGFSEAQPGAAFAGGLAGSLPLSIATGGMGGLIAREAGLGGLEGIGSAQEGERLEGGAFGAGMGAGFSKLGDYIGSVFSRPSASQRVVDGIDEVITRAEKRADKRILTKAQKMQAMGQEGADTAKRIEAGMETLPFAGGATKRIKGGFQDELNKTAARSIGMDTANLTPDVIQTAKNNISGMFDNAIQDKIIPISDNMVNTIANVVDDYASLPGAGNQIKKIGEDLFNELDAPMTAERYQKLSSYFGKKIKAAGTKGDFDVLEALGSMKDGLDDMVEQGLGGDALGDFQQARSLYKNFMALTKNRHVIDPVTGNVSGKRLFGEMSKQGKAYNVSGELGDMARLSTIPGVGDSGTASRLLIPMALGGAALGGGSMVDAGLGTAATLGGLRLLDEMAQVGVPGVTAEGMGMLGGAISRARE